MDLNSLELGLIALKGNYMTLALDDWFIYLQCYFSSHASFTACYLKTTEINLCQLMCHSVNDIK